MRIYVACLASYNNGLLHGAWIDASTDVDSMQDEINAMLRASRFPNVTVKCVECEGSGEKTFHNSETGATRQDKCPTCNGAGNVPSAEEWAIHDHEGLGNIGEHAGLATVAERVKLAEVADDSGIPLEVVLEVADDNITNDVESFIRDNYRGQYDSWAAFAEEFTEETDGLRGVPDHIKPYIDFEAMGRDWRISGDFHYVERDGSLFVFWNH
ncbi:antirestriction protein ArdA [Bradyrhizobium sp. LeoA1S1]